MSVLQLYQGMQKLWLEHVLWTRLYIISSIADLPDKDITAARLMRNQVDIGNAIKPFYGNIAGNRLTQLLQTHIMLATVILDALKQGDVAKANRAKNSWYQNADKIATFLSNANPYWATDAKKMMRNHLKLTLDEVSARLGQKYAADQNAFQLVEDEVLQMADMLSAGITRQFPSRFTR
jgi:hypothetical protein